MRALVKTKKGVGNIELINVEEKKIGINDVKIKVISSGICGTDIHVYYGEVPYEVPVILGHEFSGIIAECGSGVTEFNIGEKVTAEPHINICGKCIYCKEGNYNLCVERRGMGRIADGSFADYVVLNKKVIHKIPETMDIEFAALTEPLSVAVHAINKCNQLNEKSSVIVRGPGTIGIFVAMLLRLKGIKVKVIGLSSDKKRLEIASQFGAQPVIDKGDLDYRRIISNLNSGYGADCLFECSGAKFNSNEYLNLLRKGGTIIQVGLFKEKVPFDFSQLALNEITITGSFGLNWFDFEEAMKYLSSGKIPFEKLSIKKVPIADWSKGFKYAMEKRFLKVMLAINSI